MFLTLFHPGLAGRWPAGSGWLVRGKQAFKHGTAGHVVSIARSDSDGRSFSGLPHRRHQTLNFMEPSQRLHKEHRHCAQCGGGCCSNVFCIASFFHHAVSFCSPGKLTATSKCVYHDMKFCAEIQAVGYGHFIPKEKLHTMSGFNENFINRFHADIIKFWHIGCAHSSTPTRPGCKFVHGCIPQERVCRHER